MTFSSRISGVGMYLPPKVLKNKDLESMMDTTDEWIVSRTGIRERRWVEGKTTTSDLALQASNEALKDANLAASGLDCILLATLSPDHEFPGTACFLQQKLNVAGIPAIDVRQQCSGFIYSLSIADHFIRAGTYKNILIAGAEVHSKGMDRSPKGRDVSVLFGDGAGAVVLTRADENSKGRLLSTHIHADGAFAKELWIAAPGSVYEGARLNLSEIEEGLQFPQMNGRVVFQHAVKRIPEAIFEAMNANSWKAEDVDLFVLHQANLRINEKIAADLKIPSEKIFNTIEQIGNTTAATIPIGLAEAKRKGKLKPGMKVVSAAFGSGFTWGSAAYVWG